MCQVPKKRRERREGGFLLWKWTDVGLGCVFTCSWIAVLEVEECALLKLCDL